MSVSAFVAGRDRVLRVTHADADLTTVLNECLAALHDVTDFRWAALMTVDPQTILPTAGVVEGFTPDACGPFWDIELVWPGYNKFTSLARSTNPVATLDDATDGDLNRSPAYTQLYSTLGVDDELRAAFVLGSSCWGIVSLLRESGRGTFPSADVDDVRQLSRFIARALRRALLHDEARRGSHAAIVFVDANNRIVEGTVEARQLLEEVRGVHFHHGTVEDSELPGMLLALVTRARFNQAGLHVTTRVRGASGTWFRVAAARMTGDAGHVALIIEPARTSDLVPIVLEGFGLSEREVEIVGYLARGLSSQDIAAELSISAHTVRDHVKAVLRKCGAANRGDLVARLFTNHIQPAFEEAVHRRG